MRDDDIRPMPAPWRAERTPGGYRVTDANGRPLVFIYAKSVAARATNYDFLSWEEARRLAVNIAKLPERMKQG